MDPATDMFLEVLKTFARFTKQSWALLPLASKYRYFKRKNF